MLRAAVLAGLLIVCFPAHGGYFARDRDGNIVRVNDKPCEIGGWLKQFRSAEILYKGKSFKACWTLVGKTVLLIDEEGDVSGVPIGEFQKELES